MIRPMTANDVDAVVALHLEAFPSFFLSFLGPRFLRLLYKAILQDRGAVALVAADAQGRITGFVAGVAEQAAFYSRVIRHDFLRFGLAAASAAARRPSIVPRLFRALRRPAEAREASAPALLMSIAVSPAARGGNVGRTLVVAFTEEIRKIGVTRYCLTTDAVDNEATNAFYRATGFELARTFVTPEGRQMNEYLMRV